MHHFKDRMPNALRSKKSKVELRPDPADASKAEDVPKLEDQPKAREASGLKPEDALKVEDKPKNGQPPDPTPEDALKTKDKPKTIDAPKVDDTAQASASTPRKADTDAAAGQTTDSTTQNEPVSPAEDDIAAPPEEETPSIPSADDDAITPPGDLIIPPDDPILPPNPLLPPNEPITPPETPPAEPTERTEMPYKPLTEKPTQPGADEIHMPPVGYKPSRPGKEAPLPPAVKAHNAKMRLKKQSTLPQEPPKDDPNAPKGDENRPTDVPPALALALRHMEIVAARSKPPVTPGVQRHMKLAAGQVGEGEGKEEKPKLPPNLEKAWRAMQIVGSRTPEGRALVAAATGKPEDAPKEGGPPKPQIKIRAATGLDDGDDDQSDEDGDAEEDGDKKDEKPEGDGLPPELRASRRHMEIFAASHKGGGPAPVPGGADAPVPVEGGTPAPPTDERKPRDEPKAEDAPKSADDSNPAEDPRPADGLNPADTPKSDDTAKPGDIPKPGDAPKPPPAQPGATSTPVQRAKVRAKATGTSGAGKGPFNPTSAEILRYRYHHGVNLGSVYVLEKWLAASAFPPDAPEDATSELACVTAWVKKIGAQETQKKFEERWSKAMSEEDWKWVVSKGKVTTIRLPIGYFTLGPDFVKGTPFEQFGKVYKTGWATVKKFVTTAHEKGVGVLVDLHALPGGANAAEHSGTNSRAIKFWGDTTNLDLATKCLEFIAKESKDLPGVVGIQLVNEAEWAAHGMYEFYDKAAAAIAAIDPTIPLYFSDAWNLAEAAKYMKERNKTDKKGNPLVADTHIYFCFTDEDKSQSPTQIIERASKELHEIESPQDHLIHQTGATGVIIGEYSCTLSQETWSKHTGDKEAAKKEFGNKQGERFAAVSGGSFFWTLKMDWMDGGDWGFVAQTKEGAVKAPEWLSFSRDEVEWRTQNADSKAKALKEGAVKAHVEYWSQHRGKLDQVKQDPGRDGKPSADIGPQSAAGSKSDTKKDAPAQAPAQQPASNPVTDPKKDANKELKPDPKSAPPKSPKQTAREKAQTKPAAAQCLKPDPNKPDPSKPDTSPKATGADLYIKGWELGWNDARAFFRSRNEGDVPNQGADRIGLRELWVLKRVRESGVAAEAVWEFEQGVWKGIRDFEDVALD